MSFFRSLLVLVAVVAATSAEAGERWRYHEPQARRAIPPGNFMLGADGSSLWIFSDDGVRRVDAAGMTVGLLAAAPRAGAFMQGKPMADGGAVLIGTFAGACTLTRVDAALRERWTHRIDGACDVVPNADGTTWVLDYANHVVKLGADGRVLLEISRPLPLASLAAMPDGGVAIATSDQATTRSQVSAYTRDGVLRWTFMRDGVRFTGLAADADGTVTVAGIAPASGYSAGTLKVWHLRNDGVPAREYTSTATEMESYATVTLAADGSALVQSVSYRGFDDVVPLYRFGADGQLLWRQEPCVSMSAAGSVLQQVPLAGGGAAVACGSQEGGLFLRLDANGAIVANVPLVASSTRLALRADGHLQTLGDGYVIGLPALAVLDLDGRPVAAPTPMADAPIELVDRQSDAEGASYLLSRSTPGDGKVILAKVDAGGAVRWRRSIEAIATRLTLAGGQVCITGARSQLLPWPQPGFPVARVSSRAQVTCVAAADGADRWSRMFETSFAEHYFGALADGGFVHVRSENGAYELVRHDGAGNVVSSIIGGGLAQSAVIDASGYVALGLYDDITHRRLMQYDPQNRVRQPQVVAEYGLEVVGAGPQGVLALRREHYDSPQFELLSYTPEGTLAWSRPITTEPTMVTVQRTGDAVYLAEPQRQTPTPQPGTLSRLSRLRASDGAPVWQATTDPTTSDPPGSTRLAFAVSATQLALVRESRHRLRVQRYDVRDGAAIGTQVAACDVYCGVARGVALDEDGTARVALSTADHVRGLTATLVALSNPFALAPVRLDQPGLTGAWWATYANGEGFVADWLPDSRTWFMPWFTFSTAGSNDPSGQRWYAVAGQVAVGVTQAELPIVQATGGTFDTGGGVTSRQVGTATLRFTDCDNGTLRYAFDAGENDGASGTITLSRLTPATQDCLLADGSVQSRATTPANGFDARMSGSWYEEATSGQGLQFTVQPGGVFFAPWFTFDPAGTSEPADPGRQRWYALQGSLANAVNGKAELVIAQAIGGALDSAPADNQFAVGSATLTMTACDRATLDYRFDAGDLAGDMSGRMGTIALTKIGGCAP